MCPTMVHSYRILVTYTRKRKYQEKHIIYYSLPVSLANKKIVLIITVA